MTTMDTIGTPDLSHLGAYQRAMLPAYRELLHQQHTDRGNLSLRLDAVTDPIARTVLAFHSRKGDDCRGCELEGVEDCATWPCWTVLLVADAARVAVPGSFEKDLDGARQALR